MESLSCIFNLGGSEGKITRCVIDLYNYYTDLFAET